jgi:hypothetical protein
MSIWIYNQQTGAGYLGRLKKWDGYSGFGDDKNKYESQGKPGMGPIPVGAYNIGSLSDDYHHGPVAIHLVPVVGTNVFGRSGFLVHGDSIESPGAASHGCIIAPRAIREDMVDGHDKLLLVIPELT